MFKPILHNLLPTDAGFKEVQHYNKLITCKPINGNLKEKIEAQRLWEIECIKALEIVKEILRIVTVS